MRYGWPIASLAALLVGTAPVRADTRSIDFQGPSAVLEGERAVFYSRSIDGAFACEARSRDGQKVAFSGEVALPAGEWTVRPTGDLGASPRRLRVRALPPPVSPNLPIEQRLATVEIFCWDGDKSVTGRVLEYLGGTVGKVATPSIYKVKWILSGRQATRANVGYAIDELARRGYVLDVFSSVHGYPIQLADGPWTNVASNPGLKSTRIFYTTACHGAEGEKEFRDAGVRTYVGARGTNFVSFPHLTLTVLGLSRGKTIQQASLDAYLTLSAIAHKWPIEWLATKLLKRGGVMSEGEEIDAPLLRSRPIVFGDRSVGLHTDPPSRPAAAARGPTARGLVARLGID